jgi:hypothetical protein
MMKCPTLQNNVLKKYGLKIDTSIKLKIDAIQTESLALLRRKLMQVEAKFSQFYFKQIFQLIPERIRPEGRKTFKAYDGVNNLFNLAYELLAWKLQCHGSGHARKLGSRIPRRRQHYSRGYNRRSYVDSIDCCSDSQHTLLPKATKNQKQQPSATAKDRRNLNIPFFLSSCLICLIDCFCVCVLFLFFC